MTPHPVTRGEWNAPSPGPLAGTRGGRGEPWGRPVAVPGRWGLLSGTAELSLGGPGGGGEVGCWRLLATHGRRYACRGGGSPAAWAEEVGGGGGAGAEGSRAAAGRGEPPGLLILVFLQRGLLPSFGLLVSLARCKGSAGRGGGREAFVRRGNLKRCWKALIRGAEGWCRSLFDRHLSNSRPAFYF